MRERPYKCISFLCSSGITPAYAGKTSYSLCLLASSWDHPRVCGKDKWKGGCEVCCGGSPPRMRERLITGAREYQYIGITPAYAGKTPFATPFKSMIWDHPRVCGKDVISAVIIYRGKGSPPRMRERPGESAVASVIHRITPAYAGKTLEALTYMMHKWDHPRVCGKDAVTPMYAVPR